MRINEKKMVAVLALPGPQRYSHFIKVAADQQKVWGLFKDGWALVGTNDGKQAFPVWPAKEYAELCAIDDWGTYSTREIALDVFLDVLIPKLSASSTLVVVFPTPTLKGVTPDLQVIENDLRNELKSIE